MCILLSLDYNKWKKTIKENINQYYFKQDIEIVNKNKHNLLKDLIDDNDINYTDKYIKKLNDEIDWDLKYNEINEKVIQMICGNSKILWTKKIDGKRECKLCHEKIIKPIMHILKGIVTLINIKNDDFYHLQHHFRMSQIDWTYLNPIDNYHGCRLTQYASSDNI